MIEAILIMALSSLTAATGGLLLKLSSKKGKTIMNKLLLGIALYFVSLIFFIWALSIVPLSIAFNISALTYVFAFIFGIIIIKEKVSLSKIIGIMLIISGIILLVV